MFKKVNTPPYRFINYICSGKQFKAKYCTINLRKQPIGRKRGAGNYARGKAFPTPDSPKKERRCKGMK
jgi:hypothetical protein